MKFFRSIPETEEHRSFFSDYARFDKGIVWLIVVSQIISGLTESVMFYATGYDSFIQFGHKIAVFFGVCAAFAGVGLIEFFGLRFMLPQATRQFLYRRFQGAHLAMTIFIVLVTAILIGASYFLSLGGSEHTVTTQIDKAERKQTEKIQAGHGESLQDVEDTYMVDSMEVETRYAALVASVNQRYNGEQDVAQNNLVTWTSKKGNYGTRINKARTALKQVEANRGRELADLQQKKALEHQSLRTSYKQTNDSLQVVLTTTLSDTSESFSETEDKFSSASFWVVLVAISVSIVCIILRSIYQKGSGQKELPVPTDYDFRPSLFTEAMGAWKERIETQARNAIVAFESNTPQAELSKRVNTVYDRNQLRELVIKLEVEQLDDAKRTIQIAAPVVEQDAKPRKIGFHSTRSNEAVNNASVNNASVMDMYGHVIEHWSQMANSVSGDPKKLGSAYDFHIDTFNKLKPANRTSCIERYHKRLDTYGILEAAKNNSSVGKSDHNCLECGNDISHRRSDAKYCNDTCRLNFHAHKHGGNKFNPKLKNK